MISFAKRQFRILAWVSVVLLVGCHQDHGSDAVTVPSVVGQTQSAASAAITGAGLTVGSVTMANSATVAAGIVISQNPVAATSVAPGSTVSLTVSSGPAMVAVPNVIGQTQAAATTAITGAGLTVGSVTMANSATVAAGIVISQNPVAASSVAPGSAVSLTVSSGPTPGPTESILHSFGAVPDGQTPIGPLIQATDGSFYGTTASGGTQNSGGTVYRIDPDGTETVLYSFGASDGDGPTGGVVQGADGNFYGTTSQGGPAGTGEFFKLTPAGTFTVLYNFVGGTDAATPNPGLTLASDGNFYGTSQAGGAHNQGAVFKISSSGAETVLFSFSSSGVGAYQPQTGVTEGPDGNFYGVTYYGGTNNEGAVFQITPAGVEAVIYSFGVFGSGDALRPSTPLILGTDGNLYGTSDFGGLNNSGTVYQITTTGVETVLASLGSIGIYATATGVIQGKDGNFYGTTQFENSGANSGTVFKVTSSGTITVVYEFGAAPDADQPNSLVQGADGNFYGASKFGGTQDFGAVFKFTP